MPAVRFTPSMPPQPTSSHPIYDWRILRAGRLRLDGGSMFGVVPKAIWSRLVAPDEHNRIPLQTNCLLLSPSASGSAGGLHYFAG